MPAKLNQQMKDLVAAQQCFIATCDNNNHPNIGPKRSTRVLDDHTLIFTEGTAKQTYNNILENPYVAVAVVDRENLTGYRFAGRAEVLEAGEFYDQAAQQAQKMGMPAPKAVVTITVEEIYDLKPGTAGNRIDE